MQTHTLVFVSSQIKIFLVRLYVDLNWMVLHYYLILTHKTTYKLDVSLTEMLYADHNFSAFVTERFC
jgi:hypothetical protein